MSGDDDSLSLQGMIAFVSGLLAGLTDCFSGIVSIPRLDGAILERWEHQRRKSMGALARRRQPEEPSDEERKRWDFIFCSAFSISNFNSWEFLNAHHLKFSYSLLGLNLSLLTFDF